MVIIIDFNPVGTPTHAIVFGTGFQFELSSTAAVKKALDMLWQKAYLSGYRIRPSLYAGNVRWTLWKEG